VTAPDYFRPTSGWRVWLVVREHGELRLASVMYPTLWIPRREEIAVCRPAEPPVHADSLKPLSALHREPHASPHEQCGCGIYASKTLLLASSYFDGHGPAGEEPLFRVIGRVSLWGRVIEGEYGFRASHAYPSQLYVPAAGLNGVVGATPGDVARALAVYGVPVELLDGPTKRRVAGRRAPLAA
jgi:hypothetical protein